MYLRGLVLVVMVLWSFGLDSEVQARGRGCFARRGAVMRVGSGVRTRVQRRVQRRQARRARFFSGRYYRR